MKLDFSTAAQLRDLVAKGEVDRLRTLTFEEITLGAVMEIACTNAAWGAREEVLWETCYKSLRRKFAPLEEAQNALDLAFKRDLFRIPRKDVAYEIHCLTRKEDFDGKDWISFQENFVKRAQGCGFERQFVYGLVGAFNEIAQNIADHSSPEGQPMSLGWVGYNIVAGEVHFAVADIGRGCLASLRENPRWDGLENSRQALETILWNHGTRKIDSATGGGFKQVWKSILDRNGTVALQSGDGYAEALVITGAREQRTGFRNPLSGFRFSASCSLKGLPIEAGIKFIDSRSHMSE
jgi:hypothetical protein